MKSKIKCPNCGQEYIVDDSFIGQTAECKICGMTFSTRRKSQNTKTIIITILLIAGSLFFIVVLLGFGAAGTVKRDYMKGLEAKKEHRDDEALKYFRIAAEKGHAEAQFELGQYYEKENEEENEEAFLTNMEAARWYLKAAVQGHTEAQYRLGKHYLTGVEAGREEAARWFLLAAADGHKEAQYELGRCFLDGKGIPKDLDAAEKSFETAAKQGNTDAGKYLDIIKTIKSANQGNVQDQYKLGELYIAGDIVKEDKNEAFKWFRKAAEQGYKDAQYQLGVCFYRGDGVGKNVSETMKWWKKAAEQGHGKAQSNIGVLFYNGNGVEKDLSEAVKWFRMAAEQGNREAQKNLGHCFYVGDGVEKDLSEAVKWFLKAAEQGEEYASAFLDSMNADYNLINKAVQGDTDAQFQLAETLRKNLKWDKSIEDTRLNDMMFTWYEKAANQGNWKAQYNLGVCYYKRYDQIFIRQNPEITKEAFEWFQKAAEQGHAKAQCILGYIYYYGNDSYSSISEIGAGIDKDRNKALAWFKKAAEHGDETARYNLEVFSNNRTIRKPDIEWNDLKEVGEKVNLEEIEKTKNANKNLMGDEQQEEKRQEAEAEQKTAEQEKMRQKENSDEDSDGFTYAQETEAGTNPRDPSSHPKYITQVYISSVSQQSFSGLELVSIETRGGKGTWEASFNVISNNRKRSEVVRINDKFYHNNTRFSVVDIEDTNLGHIQNGRFITTYIVYIQRVGKQERIPCRIKEPIYDPVLRVNFVNALNNREFSAAVGNTFKVGNSRTGEEQYKVISASVGGRDAVVESVDKNKKRYNLNAINPKRIEENIKKASSSSETGTGKVLTDAERTRLRAQQMEANRKTEELIREMDRKMDRKREEEALYELYYQTKNRYR